MKLSNKHRISSIAARCARPAAALRVATFALLLGAAWPLAAQTASSKFLQTFLLYYGGGPTLVASDAARLAKFDLLNFDRFRYNQIGPNTWASIKALNPNVSIYLYEDGPDVYNDQDALPQISLNTVGRYNVSRGHPMGSLNGDHPELFLLDAGGNRIYSLVYSNPAANHFNYLLDFGSAAYQSYWLTAVKADIIDQPWVADGVHADDCVSSAAELGDNAIPAKYSTQAAWSAGMNSFVSAIAAGLHGYGQKLWCNKGGTRLVDGSASWLALDAGANPPDVFLEEGAFAVMWGPWSVQFFQESEWKRQVDTMAALKHTKAAMLSHTQLAVDQTGTDNYGHPVTFWQTLWYSLGSFLLGRDDVLGNAFFSFHGGDSDYNKIIWYDEYDKIDLGKALGSYTVTTIGGVNIYSREFEKGYVYVNPTPNNVASVTLPQASRQLTHGNLLSLLDSIPIVNAISLSGLNAAILLKTVVVPVVDIIAPSTPAGLSASAVSSSQINLSWSASTDNVGVTGYRVYRAGTLLATLGAVTTYQNTGLTPSTSFSYTVLAIDAAGNASTQSAPASATTQAAPDTTAPSVPGGLTAVAASSSQIKLSWSASTDNVGVTGYKVFRNGVQIAATGALTYANTGLLPATTYSFAVAAFDAAGNSSAQSAAVSKRTLAVRVARDFNGDGRSDILWHNSTTGENVIWLMNGAAISSSVTFATVADPNWSIAGVGDFNGDGKSDILWRNRATGENAIWLMNGAAISSAAMFATVADPNWSIAGVGDFNGDGKSDILWHHRATGENAIWLMNGTAISSGASIAAVTDLNWSIAGVGDFNGDGKSDILWRNSTTGENAVYFMNGAAISSSAGMNAMTDLNWSIAGVGDFDADGKSDVLWHNNVTGENIVWLMNGTTLLSSGAVFATVADLSWSIAGVGDLDGDGKSDILWRNSTTGENTVWSMSGASISSGAPINTVQGSWSTVR